MKAVIDYSLLNKLSKAAAARYAAGEWSLDRALAHLVAFLAVPPLRRGP